MREKKIIKRKLCRFTILDFKYDLILSLYPRPVPPFWFLAAGTTSPLPQEALAQTRNENSCKAYSFELLSVPHCLGSCGLYSCCRRAHRWRVNHSHTSLFSIVRFHASDVGWFFGHQNFHEFREAVFKLSCCLGEKKENHEWCDDLQPVPVTAEQTSQSPSFKGKRLVFRLPC